MIRRLWLQWLAIGLMTVIALTTAASPAAAQPVQIVDVRVDGNVRVESEAVLRQLRTRAGSEITLRTLGRDVRAVYDLGFFDDVHVEATETEDGIVLTFVVAEKPSIGLVEFVGADALGEEDFEEAVSLRVGAILDETAVRRAANSLEDLYREKGYFLVEVDYEIVDGDPGEVIVRFHVSEFAKVRVAAVTIVGNESISDGDIQRYLQTRPGTFLSFITGTGKFDIEVLQSDLQTLRMIYYESGYIDIDVEDPVVELSRDRESIFVTIPITEGPQYTISSVSVSGELLESQEETMERLSAEAGDVFRSSTIREDIEALQSYYQDLGYAYATVNLPTTQDAENETIGITYDVQRGELAYVGRIRFVGNGSTRDRVLRREVAIAEGDLYSRTGIELSKAYLQRLGFFESVEVRERPSSLGANLIDLEVEVVERHTRSLQIGAGFSSVESFLATAQISENNLMGRGQSLSLNAMFSSVRQLFVLSFIEPHLWGSAVSLQLDVFNRSLALRNFDRLSRGASASFGYRPFRHHQFWRNLTFYAGYRIEDIRLRNVSTTRSSRFFQNGLTSTLTQGVAYDARNDRFTPTEGYYLAINNDWADAAWGSDFQFDRVRGIGRLYQEADFLDCAERGEAVAGGARVVQAACRWFRAWVFRTNFEIGFIGSTAPNEIVPASERYYPGGPNSVRGFEQFSLGPRVPTPASGSSPVSSVRDVAEGGTRELLLNLELEFPLVNAVGIRGVLFADAGNAFGVGDPYSMRLDVLRDRDDNLVLRTALGFGFRWQSPLGMLRFEWGFPLQVRENERRTVFNFSIGPSF